MGGEQGMVVRIAQLLNASKGVTPHPMSAASPSSLESAGGKDPVRGATAVMGHSLSNRKNFLGPGAGVGSSEAAPGGVNLNKVAGQTAIWAALLTVGNNSTAASLRKKAVTVEPAGPVSRWTAATLGRANPLSLFNLVLTGRAYHSPQTGERRKKHEESAKLLEQIYPKELKDVIVRLGGTDAIDDLLWKRERGKQLPWYKQIGGRIWQNPRTGPFGKILGTVSYPSTMLSSLMRGSLYDPTADSISVYADEPAVTEHELGHAIDFAGMGPLSEGGGAKGYVKRIPRKLLRDAYSAIASLPLVSLRTEGRANWLSHKALTKALKDKPEELARRRARRWEVLAPAYGAEIGGTAYLINKLLAMMAFPGMFLGKAVGLARASNIRKALAKKEKEKKGGLGEAIVNKTLVEPALKDLGKAVGPAIRHPIDTAFNWGKLPERTPFGSKSISPKEELGLPIASLAESRQRAVDVGPFNKLINQYSRKDRQELLDRLYNKTSLALPKAYIEQRWNTEARKRGWHPNAFYDAMLGRT